MFSGYLILLTEVENRNFQFPGYLACYIIFSICKELSFFKPHRNGSAKILYFSKLQTESELFFEFF